MNQFMTALVAGSVERLLDRTCDWMATYVDVEDGLLLRAPADPAHVAALTGLGATTLRHASSRQGKLLSFPSSKAEPPAVLGPAATASRLRRGGDADDG